MQAMVLEKCSNLADNKTPLKLVEIAKPVPLDNELLIQVLACGVCHTELDEIEGRTPPSRLPMILGHQVVGLVEAFGEEVANFDIGDRVGVAWIHSACGHCEFCIRGEENLCPLFIATGRDVNGGYAEYMTVSEHFAYHIPEAFTNIQAAPLLCAGAIGYRSLKLTQLKNGQSLGLTGFGASAHLVLMMVKHQYPDSNVFVFARKLEEQAFAKQLGAVWAGTIDTESPDKLDCIIDTTPVWTPVVEALKNLKSGGRLVINAIRKENADKSYLEQIDYENHLWLEKEIKSVANVSRADVQEFLKLAAAIPIIPEVETYTLRNANKALVELKNKKIRGAKVLEIKKDDSFAILARRFDS